MTIFFPIFIFLFIVAVLFFGPNGALKSIPFLVMLSFIFSISIWFIGAFFPLIVIFIIYNYLKNKNNPKRSSGGARTRTYYYSSSNAKDFEEFFRQAGGNQNYGNFGSGGQSPYGAFEDKTKYYTTLGIQSGADQDEVKKAYRNLARKHHPDRYATADDDVKAYHEKKFKEINEAYDKLSRK